MTQVVHPAKRYLDINDLADQLRVSVPTLYRWRSNGEPMPKGFKIGGRVRWTQESVDRYVESQMAKESA